MGAPAVAAGLQAVILDWAGTTVDHGSLAPARAFVELFDRNRVPISMAEARVPMGLDKRDHIAALLAAPEIAGRWQASHGAPAGAADIDRLYHEFLPIQLDVLLDHAEPIAGCLEAVAACRSRGLKIGATTGYAMAMMTVLAPAAAARGYAPDVSIAGGEVPAGRPGPGMALLAAVRLGVGAVAACVKVDDTPAGIAEGLNGGMWAVGVSLSGNELGLSAEELQRLAPAVRAERRAAAEARLYRAGAHHVIDSVADLPATLEHIEARLKGGQRPSGAVA